MANDRTLEHATTLQTHIKRSDVLHEFLADGTTSGFSLSTGRSTCRQSTEDTSRRGRGAGGREKIPENVAAVVEQVNCRLRTAGRAGLDEG